MNEVMTSFINKQNEVTVFDMVPVSVCLRITYLTFCWKLFYESMLKYICILKIFEKERKREEKKWHFKKLYIKFKS